MDCPCMPLTAGSHTSASWYHSTSSCAQISQLHQRQAPDGVELKWQYCIRILCLKTTWKSPARISQPGRSYRSHHGDCGQRPRRHGQPPLIQMAMPHLSNYARPLTVVSGHRTSFHTWMRSAMDPGQRLHVTSSRFKTVDCWPRSFADTSLYSVFLCQRLLDGLDSSVCHSTIAFLRWNKQALLGLRQVTEACIYLSSHRRASAGFRLSPNNSNPPRPTPPRCFAYLFLIPEL